MRRTFVLPISILALYALTVTMSVSFKTHLVPPLEEQDLIQRMFGGLRGVVGDWAFMKAEEYHHRGLGFLKAVEHHGGESFLDKKIENAKVAAVHEDHEHEKGPAPLEEAGDIYSKIYSHIKVTKDAHLKPSEEKEVLPWFYVETAFNPHDIRGYVLGAYWLQRMGRFDEAIKFLKEGRRNNPDSADILTSLGWAYYKMGDRDNAAEYLDRACALWIAGKHPNEARDRYSAGSRFFALDLLGDIYEKGGDDAKALSVYQDLYNLDPSGIVADKIGRLKAKINKELP